MKNSLLKRVEEHSKLRKKPLKDAVKMFVLANRNELKNTLEKGHSKKAVWETLIADGKLQCTYAAFQQIIKKEFGAKPQNSFKEIENLPAKKDSKNKIAVSDFKYNPKPNEEELY